MRTFFMVLWAWLVNAGDLFFSATVARKQRQRARQARQDYIKDGGRIPGWYPEAISNSKLRRIAVSFWVEHGHIPPPRQLAAMKKLKLRRTAAPRSRYRLPGWFASLRGKVGLA